MSGKADHGVFLREAALAWGQGEDKSFKYRGWDTEVAG